MRRHTAGIIATGTLLSLTGYAAWCGQPFYMKPRVVFPEWMPAEVMDALPDAAEKAGLMEPEAFGARRLVHHLAHPWQAGTRAELTFCRLEPDTIVVGLSGAGQQRTIRFVWKRVHWRRVTGEEFPHPRK